MASSHSDDVTWWLSQFLSLLPSSQSNPSHWCKRSWAFMIVYVYYQHMHLSSLIFMAEISPGLTNEFSGPPHFAKGHKVTAVGGSTATRVRQCIVRHIQVITKQLHSLPIPFEVLFSLFIRLVLEALSFLTAGFYLKQSLCWFQWPLQLYVYTFLFIIHMPRLRDPLIPGCDFKIEATAFQYSIDPAKLTCWVYFNSKGIHIEPFHYSPGNSSQFILRSNCNSKPAWPIAGLFISPDSFPGLLLFSHCLTCN